MKCPSCGKNFNKKEFLVDHINQIHENDIPKNMNAEQYIYYSSHGTIKGKCMCGCGKDTEWNYKTGKPHKLNPDPKCRERLRQKAVKNGADGHLLKFADHQKKMQQGKSIAGTYTFKDGTKLPYLAKNELAFLKFCENVCEFTGNMIVEPYQTFKYMDGDVERFYMPDFYLPDYNLMVEIKGDNKNPEYLKDTGYKVKLKDDVMKKQKDYNYIKIVDNNFGGFLEILFNIVNRNRSNIKYDQPIILAESATGIVPELYLIFIYNKWKDIIGTAMTSVYSEMSADGRAPIYYSDGESLNMCTRISDIVPNNEWKVRVQKYIGPPEPLNSLYSYIASGAFEGKYLHPIMGLPTLFGDLDIPSSNFINIE